MSFLKKKNTARSAKNGGKKQSYGEVIKSAYESGYNAGWTDCTDNAAFGAAVTGAVGYGNGYRAKKRYNKAQRSEAYVKRIRSKTR